MKREETVYGRLYLGDQPWDQQVSDWGRWGNSPNRSGGGLHCWWRNGVSVSTGEQHSGAIARYTTGLIA